MIIVILFGIMCLLLIKFYYKERKLFEKMLKKRYENFRRKKTISKRIL